MLAHPLLITCLIVDLLALVLLGLALPTAIRLLWHWAPQHSDATQLSLEARAEGASILARYAVGCLALTTALSTIALTSLLPEIVPGAMCGTGVLQAMAEHGPRAVGLRCLALGLLAAWHLVDRLNRSQPMAPWTTHAARALLLASPVVVLAVWETYRGLGALDVQQPVDCCAAVYDQVRSASVGPALRRSSFWLGASLAGTIALLGLALALWRSASAPRASLGLAVAVISIGWVLGTIPVLLRDLAPYHYGVLAHYCPWCLFLGDHYAVGYPLFGALGLVLFEGVAALLTARFGWVQGEVLPLATRRTRTAAWRLVAALLLFWSLGGLPALIWRQRWGTWMGG